MTAAESKTAALVKDCFTTRGTPVKPDEWIRELHTGEEISVDLTIGEIGVVGIAYLNCAVECDDDPALLDESTHWTDIGSHLLGKEPGCTVVMCTWCAVEIVTIVGNLGRLVITPADDVDNKILQQVHDVLGHLAEALESHEYVVGELFDAVLENVDAARSDNPT